MLTLCRIRNNEIIIINVLIGLMDPRSRRSAIASLNVYRSVRENDDRDCELNQLSYFP